MTATCSAVGRATSSACSSPRARRPRTALAVADRLRAVLAEPFHVADREVRLSASIGVARSDGGTGRAPRAGRRPRHVRGQAGRAGPGVGLRAGHGAHRPQPDRRRDRAAARHRRTGARRALPAHRRHVHRCHRRPRVAGPLAAPRRLAAASVRVRAGRRGVGSDPTPHPLRAGGGLRAARRVGPRPGHAPHAPGVGQRERVGPRGAPLRRRGRRRRPTGRGDPGAARARGHRDDAHARRRAGEPQRRRPAPGRGVARHRRLRDRLLLDEPAAPPRGHGLQDRPGVRGRRPGAPSATPPSSGRWSTSGPRSGSRSWPRASSGPRSCGSSRTSDARWHRASCWPGRRRRTRSPGCCGPGRSSCRRRYGLADDGQDPTRQTPPRSPHPRGDGRRDPGHHAVRHAAQHLRHAGPPPQAAQAVAGVRQPRAGQEHPARARARARHPAGGLALPRPSTSSASTRHRHAGRHHRRRDRARSRPTSTPGVERGRPHPARGRRRAPRRPVHHRPRPGPRCPSAGTSSSCSTSSSPSASTRSSPWR